ncbi:MAG: pre-peptidase C-terminal domain-containing protein [Thermoanaerobaculaceae bacterium]
MPTRHQSLRTACISALAILTLAVCAAAQPVADAVDSNDHFVAYIGTNAYQFSPALPGELGRVTLHTILSHPDAAAARDLGRAFWRLEVRDVGDRLVRTASGRVEVDDLGYAFAEFAWDGRDQVGALVPAGTYRFTFRARFLPFRLLASQEIDGYEHATLERPADEAYASTGEIVVNYDLDVESSLVLRASRATGACSVQQNSPIEAGFGYNFYYGGMHSHSNYSDGGYNPSSCSSGGTYGAGAYGPTEAYDYARNQAGLDFWAVTEHNHLMPEALTTQNPPLTEAKIKQYYQSGLQKAAAASVDGAFVALFGIEFGVTTNSDQGHVIVLESPAYINWETCSTCGATPECTPGTNCYFDVYAPKRYGYLQFYQRSTENPSPAGALGILCHPGSSEFDNYAYNAYADEAMQGIAVRSGSAFSTATTCADANAGTADYFSKWTKALSVGFHVAPTGESDAHCANYGVAVPTRTVYLIANNATPVLTRTNLLQAHKARRFFATEDPNLQLVFATGDGAHVMGDIFSAGSVTLRVGVYDPDGESVSAIEIWRGQAGSAAPTAAYASNASQATFSITESLSSGTYYYFAKVRQADGHDAYSAPMWVTFTGSTTYSISGNAGTGGATVTAGSASTTADASGNYIVSGLAAGTYTVSASRSGCTFSPTSLSVTVGPNASGKNFTASCPPPTFSISGNAGTAGATLSTGGTSTTADASGNYTLSGLVAGTYTVTPSKSGCTFSPTSLSVTLGPDATGKSFTATCGGGDTELASGVALTGQSVAYQQWKYYYITVPSGATSLELKTTSATADVDIYTRAGSKPDLSTYTCRPYTGSGNETCTQSNPTAGIWWIGVYGYAAASFTVTGTFTLPVPTYSISGSAGTSGATVTAGTLSATSDSSNNYTVAGLVAGTYTVTPSKSGCTFSPTSLSVTVGPNATGKSFTATCGSGDTQLTSGVTIASQTVALGAWRYYYIAVPTGASKLELKTTSATADVDIYTQVTNKPTSSSYICRPYSSSGNETCTATNPAAGTWWLGVYGYKAATFSVTGTVTMGTTPTERLANGTFESITSSTNTAPDGSWTRSAYTGTSFSTLTAAGSYPHGGTDYATTGQYNGSSQTLDSALVTLPSAATSATLSFWVSIVTEETSSTAYDTLKVQLVSSSGSVLATLATLSNANKTASASTYVQNSYSVLAYKGQQVKVRFVATNGSTKITTFRIDDVSLKSDG